MNIKSKIIVTLIIPVFLLMFSCQNPTEKKPETPSSSLQVETPKTSVPDETMERGLKVYKTHCFACHQMTGDGIKGIYPPLFENETVTGDKTRLIEIILKGMSGEIEIKGIKYNQVMIPHNFLTDDEIAHVITYIRNSFENQAEAVNADEVKKIRKQLNVK